MSGGSTSFMDMQALIVADVAAAGLLADSLRPRDILHFFRFVLSKKQLSYVSLL